MEISTFDLILLVGVMPWVTLTGALWGVELYYYVKSRRRKRW